MRVETKLIHSGEPRPRMAGAVAMPVFQSSTFTDDGAGSYHDLKYIRLNNTPNHVALHDKLAALEGTEAALVTASGMAAISTALLAVLGAGDHVIAHRSLYGGTYDLLTRDLKRLGIGCSFVDANDPASWAAAVTPATKVFYVETITNPLVQVVALDEVARFARDRGLVSMIDNTLATPINYRPAEHGFEVVLHSASKYLNGHSDIVAGVIAGRRELLAEIKHKLDHLGGSLDPHACFLLHRGLKTLALRVRHQNDSTLALARYLAGHAAVARVHYPGLDSHPQHARAARWFAGAGGVLSFELAGGVPAVDRMFARLTLPTVAPSLGGTETLITRPALTSHASLDPDVRRGQGIADGLVRLAVGLEATDDLIEDFAAAIASS
ncbi:MAG TPA: PLP-dependent aspartate aminotransferase family protein [Kofleriaceae bacterium]